MFGSSSVTNYASSRFTPATSKPDAAPAQPASGPSTQPASASSVLSAVVDTFQSVASKVNPFSMGSSRTLSNVYTPVKAPESYVPGGSGQAGPTVGQPAGGPTSSVPTLPSGTPFVGQPVGGGIPLNPAVGKPFVGQPVGGSTPLNPASGADPAKDASARAKGAQDLVAQMDRLGTVYDHSRDWNDMKKCDCSKFVQLALEKAGQGDVFGRENAQTGEMRERIAELSGPNAYRKSDPKPGDIMMWDDGKGSGHVAIVTSVDPANDKITFAQMGNSGANEFSWSLSKLQGDAARWESKGWVNGSFCGFWTPPAASSASSSSASQVVGKPAGGPGSTAPSLPSSTPFVGQPVGGGIPLNPAVGKPASGPTSSVPSLPSSTPFVGQPVGGGIPLNPAVGQPVGSAPQVGSPAGPSVLLDVPFFSQFKEGNGFTPGKTACFKAAVAMAKQGGASVLGPDQRIQVGLSEDSKGKLTVDPQKAKEGRSYIDAELAAGRPVVVGVSHKDSDYNADRLTDHFVTIVGKGVDESGRAYYTFHDPGTNHDNIGNGTANPNNRFYVDPDTGNLYRPGSAEESATVKRHFDVAMVRRNAESA